MKTRQLKNTIIIILISIAMVFGIQYFTQKMPVEYIPGSYYGVAKGMTKDIWVKADFDDATILNITIVDHEENSGYYETVFEELPKRIISLQSCNVDGISGATITSNGLLEAVQSTMNQAKGSASIVQFKAPYDAMNLTFKPGTYTAKAEGYDGDINLTVTFSENAIEKIDISVEGDGDEYVSTVQENIVKPVLRWQTTNIDSVSGATWTSLGVKNALRMCIEQAKKQ